MGLWTDLHARTIDLDRFRAHDQYLEQADWYPYKEIVRWLRANGHTSDLMSTYEEGAYGCRVWDVDGIPVSRDKLDSILEIGFLDRVFAGNLPKTMIDIGAGYGRLAHRMWELGHPVNFYCTDAIEVSRIACERYLRMRGVPAYVMPPAEARSLRGIDLAINVHSWSECTIPEIAWWLDALVEMQVPKLFVVPHTPNMGSWSMERGGGNGPSYRDELENRGFRETWRWRGPYCSPRSYLMFEREVGA